MKKWAVVAAMALVAFSGAVEARQFNGNGQAACVTEDKLNQIIDAANRQDKNALQYLMSHGCVIPKRGISVTILDTTWTGKVKVRAYSQGQAMELWTVNEALSK